MKRIFERVPEGKDPLLIGPETIVFSEDSKMYTFTEDGKIVRLENLVAAPNDANTVYADVVEIAASNVKEQKTLLLINLRSQLNKISLSLCHFVFYCQLVGLNLTILRASVSEMN